MTTYKKYYTRENCLIAIQIWEEFQVNRLKKRLGEGTPLTIFDAHNGVVKVYFHEDIAHIWENIVANKANNDSKFIPEIMKWYGECLDKLEKIWHNNKLSSIKELVDFFDLASLSWVGLCVSYCLPDMKDMPKESQDLGMELRKRSADFLELTDHVIQNTLHIMFPSLGDLVKYLSIEEIQSNNIPSEKVLGDRKEHYIYYNFKIFTNKDVFELAKENGIEIQEEVIPQNIRELTGQTAMSGKVTGVVRVLNNKSEIPLIKDGEILVTAMTTPDYLPAMEKAAAFVTDEGGITCHAAIVAREIGKPCVIGTKIATSVLRTGDIVEVDADKGVVKIIKQTK